MRKGVDDMSKKSIQQKLQELNKRAKVVKADPKLRHAPSEHDLKIASRHARLAQVAQTLTIMEGEKFERT